MNFHFLYNVGGDIFCEIAEITFHLGTTSSQTGTIDLAPPPQICVFATEMTEYDSVITHIFMIFNANKVGEKTLTD